MQARVLERSTGLLRANGGNGEPTSAHKTRAGANSTVHVELHCCWRVSAGAVNTAGGYNGGGGGAGADCQCTAAVAAALRRFALQPFSAMCCAPQAASRSGARSIRSPVMRGLTGFSRPKHKAEQDHWGRPPAPSTLSAAQRTKRCVLTADSGSTLRP